MSKVKLNNVVNVQNTSVINDNFQKIASELNDRVFYRDNPVGEPNQLSSDLDMNGRRQYNLLQPALDHEPATLKTVKDYSLGGQYLKTLRTPEEIVSLPVASSRVNTVQAYDSSGQPVCINPDIRTEDLSFTNPTKGVILRSPNGSYFRIKVDNSGVLSTVAV